jgi:hypothetical protein
MLTSGVQDEPMKVNLKVTSVRLKNNPRHVISETIFSVYCLTCLNFILDIFIGTNTTFYIVLSTEY